MSEEKTTRDMLLALDTIQNTINEFGKDLSTLERDKVDKAAADFALMIENNQNAQAKVNAENKARIEELELQAAKEAGIIKDHSGYSNAFNLYLRKSHRDLSDELIMDCAKAHVETIIGLDDTDRVIFTNDMVAGSNPDGGYFMLPERDSQIRTRIFETSPMRQIANVVTVSSDKYEFVLDDDEASCGWVGETQSRTDTDTPQVGLVTIPVHEVYAMPRATQKMLDNAGFNVESWLIEKGSNKMARTANTAFVTGNGVKQPRGFTTLTAWTTAGTYQRDALEVMDSGEDGGWGTSAESVIKLAGLLHEQYQPNAVYVGTRGTLTALSVEKDGNDNYLFSRDLLAKGMGPLINGKPFVVFADMAEVATDAIALGYGDFREGYTIVDRIGIRVLRDPYTSKPYIRFYMTQGVGGDVSNYEAIKLMALSA